MSEATKRNLRPESLTLIQLDELETAVINNDFLSKEFLLCAIRMARKQRSAQSENAPNVSKIVDHAEVIGNVTAALVELDATYDGNRVTFTFLSTNDSMSYIQKARRIVEERLALIRGAK
jgi:hypothetical protein